MAEDKELQEEHELAHELDRQKKTLFLQKKAFMKIISELKKQDEQDENSSIQENT